MELAFVVLLKLFLRSKGHLTYRTKVVEKIAAASFSVRVLRIYTGAALERIRGLTRRFIVSDWNYDN
jgi:hypothetical protein